MRQLSVLLLSDEGQDIAEYAMMVAVILLIVVGTLRIIGPTRTRFFLRSRVLSAEIDLLRVETKLSTGNCGLRTPAARSGFWLLFHRLSGLACPGATFFASFDVCGCTKLQFTLPRPPKLPLDG